MSTKIILADDHQLFREGLRSLLVNELHYNVVAQVSDGRSAVQTAKEMKPDLVIMDFSMPDMNGAEATRKILEHQPQIKIIALSMHTDSKYISEMLSAGASGYLLKDSAVDELERAVTTILSNRIYISPAIAGGLVKEYIRHLNETPIGANALTQTEREVLQLLAEGKSAKEIAATMDVSSKTIDVHRHNIMEKLNLHTLPELTKFAIREGLTSLE
ncbi:MAG: response regulator transcription factor [Ignavibacteriae bacterium]|nr:response regulator transcription factor [Ignavibacteriota bacterium]